MDASLFGNILKIAVRNLLNNRLYSLINIVGLAIGIGACLLIALYVQDETSYDKQWEDADNIFRVNQTLDLSGDAPQKWASVATEVAPVLQQYFSNEIAAT